MGGPKLLPIRLALPFLLAVGLDRGARLTHSYAREQLLLVRRPRIETAEMSFTRPQVTDEHRQFGSAAFQLIERFARATMEWPLNVLGEVFGLHVHVDGVRAVHCVD